jgi:hypothetical protein
MTCKCADRGYSYCTDSGNIFYVKEDAGMEFEIGQVIKLKKAHPCGGNRWEILRVGMDFRLKCLQCGHMVMVPRKLVEKNFRGFIS